MVQYLLVWDENNSIEQKKNSMHKDEFAECVAIGNTLTKNEPVACEDTTPLAGIYGLKCKTTGKWYVGQSVNIFSTWNHRYRLMHCKSQPKIYRALSKHGYNDFDKVILERCSTEILNEREVFWSEKYNSVEVGYNTRCCGGSKGKHSEETKQKMRLKAIGRKHSAESIEKMKKIKRMAVLRGKNHPNYGKKHTKEARIKIKEARAKQVITKESQQKQAMSMKRVWEERRKDGTIKDIGQKITEGKIKEWRERREKAVDSTDVE